MNDRVRVPAISAVRWGAREEKNVLGLSVVEVAQFVDLSVLGPQQLSFALYALTDAPIAGIAVQWIIQLGNGSFSHTETFSLGAADVLAQTPLEFARPAKSVQISARITSTIPDTKLVRLVAFIAPTAPTWLTDLTCTMEL